MKTYLKGEYRKLLTVRSTYFITFLAFALIIFFSFYVMGYRGGQNGLNYLDVNKFTKETLNMAPVIAIFGSIVAILLVAHEYSYNTILYTLTIARSRSKVLLAKFLILSSYALVITLIGISLSIIANYAGVRLKGAHLVHQDFNVSLVYLKSLYYIWGYIIAGFILGLLYRKAVGAIVTIFLVPTTVENLLGILLKKNQVYLPFTSLGQVIQPTLSSTFKGLFISIAYIIVGLLIAWWLFLYRDAS